MIFTLYIPCLSHDLSQFGFYDDNETVVEMQHQDVSKVTENTCLLDFADIFFQSM